MDYLLVIGLVQALFTGLFFFLKKERGTSDIVTTIFMSVVSISLIAEMIRFGLLNAPALNFISLFSYSALFGPFIYLYTKSNIDINFRLSKKSLIHLLPFLLLTLLLSYQTIIVEKRDIIKAAPRHELTPPHMTTRAQPHTMFPVQPLKFPPPPQHKEFSPTLYYKSGRSINLLLSMLLLIAYSAAILRLIRDHRSNISDYYSYQDGRVSLQWLMIITISFTLIYSYVHIVSLFLPSLFRHPLLEPVQTYTSGTILFIYIFSFFSIKQTRLITAKKTTADAKKYEKSGLKPEEAERYLSEIVEFMEEEKPYLDGDLTINSMADELDIPKHYISQILSLKLNKNFYAFVNEYRYNEAAKRLADPEHSEQTILHIAFDSGFNSKSAFNNTFKKFTTLTPAQYRKKHSLDAKKD